MANIKMCDICGQVSNQMAAEILIRPVNPNAEVFKDTGLTYHHHMDGFSKDVCHDCIGKLMEVRTLKVLEADDKL